MRKKKQLLPVTLMVFTKMLNAIKLKQFIGVFCHILIHIYKDIFKEAVSQ